MDLVFTALCHIVELRAYHIRTLYRTILLQLELPAVGGGSR